jgi:hypothetical protein
MLIQKSMLQLDAIAGVNPSQILIALTVVCSPTPNFPATGSSKFILAIFPLQQT